MRRSARCSSVIAISAAVVAMASGSALAATVQATYEMNEASGATVMVDSSANHLNGSISQAGLDTGVSFSGATGYQWAFRSPTAAPAEPARVVRVPDNSKLDPLNDTFTVELRYRTKYKFGNILQKGQSTTVGGQLKIQNPGGMPSCLFKGPSGQVGTRSTKVLSDNAWHTIKCVKTPTKLTMYVDGAVMARKTGSTGVINNTSPLTIGGKLNCDQVKVTCDYFSGMIDYVKFTRG